MHKKISLTTVLLFLSSTHLLSSMDKDEGRYEGVPVNYIQNVKQLSVHDSRVAGQENLAITFQSNPFDEMREIRRTPEWEYKCCPSAYNEDECNCGYCWQCGYGTCCTRGCVSTISSGMMAFCGLIKLIDWCAVNVDEDCHHACLPNTCTLTWFPTECSYVAGTTCSVLRWGCSLGMISGGLTGLAAWAPWWSDRGCILYKRVRRDT